MSLLMLSILSTSIYDLVLIYVCHFHQVLLLLLLQSLFKFDHYRDTRASILDPCIQGILDMVLCHLLLVANLQLVLYSTLSNCSACTLIYFERKCCPARSNLILHDYLFFKFSFQTCKFWLFQPLFDKRYCLHVLIRSCMLI